MRINSKKIFLTTFVVLPLILATACSGYSENSNSQPDQYLNSRAVLTTTTVNSSNPTISIETSSTEPSITSITLSETLETSSNKTSETVKETKISSSEITTESKTTVEKKPTEKLSKKTILYVTSVNGANIRKGPSIESEIVGFSKYSETIEGKLVKGKSWYKISENKYISSTVVSTSKPKELPKENKKVSVPEVTTNPSKITRSSDSKPKDTIDQCIDKVDPNRTVIWHKKRYGAWGTTDIDAREVYIDPNAPASKICDIVFHEWIHILQARKWGSNSSHIANSLLGHKEKLDKTGHDYYGLDAIADCGALQLGAKWINYGCPGGEATKIAKELLAGK